MVHLGREAPSLTRELAQTAFGLCEQMKKQEAGRLSIDPVSGFRSLTRVSAALRAVSLGHR